MKKFTPRFPWFPHINIFMIRNKIYDHVQVSSKSFSGTVLDVGCGHMPYKSLVLSNIAVQEYIGMDLEHSEIYNQVNADLYWDGASIPLADASVDAILLTEVLEHCPDPLHVLNETYRVLKPGGIIVFSVPFLWYLHETPYDFYRYTPYAIDKMLCDTGYKDIELETYGNGRYAFLHVYFIWLKRGSWPKFFRFIIYLVSLPFILFLLNGYKKANNSRFGDGQMFIGIIGAARK